MLPSWLHKSLRRKAMRRERRRFVEQLESRNLLAITSLLSNNLLRIDLSAPGDSATISMVGAQIRVADRDNHTESFSASDVFSIAAVGIAGSDSVMLQGDVTLPGDLKVSGVSTITLDGNYIVGSANLESSSVLTVMAGSLLSTRKTAVGADQAEGSSIGDSGDIKLVSPSISVTNASLVAHVQHGSVYQAGDVEIIADRTEPLILPTIFPVGGLRAEVDISLTDATIKGGDVSVQAASGDASLTADVPDGFGKGWANTALSYLQQIPGLEISQFGGVFASAQVRFADSQLTVTDTVISGSGKVSLGTEAATDASLRAIATSSENQNYFTLSFGYGQATSSARTALLGTTQITAGGSVGVTSKATTKAAVIAQATGNPPVADAVEANKRNVSAAIALAVTELESLTTVGSSVQIVSAGNANVSALGSDKNSPKAVAGIYEGGLAGTTFALGVDNATVRTTVDGKITARGQSSYFDPAASVNTAGNTITLPKHGLQTGDLVTYSTGGGDAIGGLKNGRTYAVIVVDENTVQLADAPAMELDARGVDPTAIHTFSKVADTAFVPQSDVDLSVNAIYLPNLPGTLPVEGQQVTYRSLGEAPVGGLEDGTVYSVHFPFPSLVANMVQLKNADGEIVALTSNDSATPHTLIFRQPAKAFQPVDDVDTGARTIRVPGHGFADGDVVVYQTDPSKSRTVSVPTDDANYSSLDVEVRDRPVGGLDDGETYFIAVVDADTIRLGTTYNQAALAKALDLTSDGDGSRHRIVPLGQTAGLGVHATLNAENSSSATAETGKKRPPASSALPAALNSPQNFLQAIQSFKAIGQAEDKVKDVTGAVKEGSDEGTGAGALAVNYFNHGVGVADEGPGVQVVIGPNAVLQSAEDLTVDAAIKQSVGLYASAGASGESGSAAAVGIGVGLYNNSAATIIREGAQLDAYATLAVNSKVDYPWLSDPLDAINPIAGLQNGPSAIPIFFDGSFGVIYNMFNTTADTAASGGSEGISIGGALAVTVFNNTAKTLIESGVLINQDASTVLDAGAGGTFRDGPQQVNVGASTLVKSLDMVGMVSLGFNHGAVRKAVKANDPKTRNNNEFKISDLFNPIGVDGGKGGIGASILVNVMENTTTAEVESGAKIYAGLGGLAVNAETDIFSFAFAQSGASGSKFGIGGSAAGAGINNVTHALLEPGVKLESAGDIGVTANDQTTRINIVGGIFASKAIAAGVSIGVNEITRNTVAVIGAAEPDADLSRAADTSVNTAGALNVTATNNGDLWSFTVAGAVAAPEKPEVKPPATTSPKAKAMPVSPPPAPPDTGIGVAGDVSYNRVDDRTVAAIHTPGTITAQHVNVRADEDTNLWTAAGAVAMVTVGQKISVGIAGSLSIDLLDAVTRAYVADVVVDAGKLDVRADHGGFIHSLTASGSLTENTTGSGTSVSVAASVSINEVDATTEAFLEDADITLSGAATIKATDDSDIQALAGTLGAASGAKAVAFGFSAAGNRIDNKVRASADGTVLTATAVTVKATTDADILAVTVGGVLAKGAATSNSAGVAIAGALSVNEIHNSVVAEVKNGSTLTVMGDVYVDAHDNASIMADGGGFALVLKGGGGSSVGVSVGLAAASNQITDGLVQALIDDSTIHSTAAANYGVSVTATESASIQALTLGGAVSATQSGSTSASVAPAGAGSGNAINNTVIAAIRNGASVTAAESNVLIAATDTSTITADAGGFGIALAVGSNAVSVSVGIAASVNEISNSVNATIDRSTVSAQETVVVQAIEAATIDALTIGGAVSGSVAGGSGVGIGLAGAGSGNFIDNQISALIKSDSVVTSAGDVTVKASDESTITADAGGIGLAAAIGPSAAVGIALGVGFAKNEIANSVTAVVDNSSVTAAGSVLVWANENATIDALTFGGAAEASAAGSGGVGVSVAGAGSYNDILNKVEAAIRGASGVEANEGSLTVLAVDSSQITADGGGIGVAIGASTDGAVALTVGFSVASNTVKNTVRAAIDLAGGAQAKAHTTTTVQAIESSEIMALTIGGAVAVAVGGDVGVGVAGAGAGSTNLIMNTVKAFAHGGQVSAELGDVQILAWDGTTIRADAGGLAIGIGGGGAVGVGVTVGASVVSNEVRNTVRADIGSSTVTAHSGKVTVQALERTDVDGLAVGGAASGSGGGVFGGAAAGAGAQVENVLANKVEAYVLNSTVNADGGNLTIEADDTTLADAKAVAGSLAAGFGSVASGAIAVGASITNNDVRNLVTAYSSNSILDATGNITLRANTRADADALSVAASLAVAGAPASLSFSGAGASAKNLVANTIQASIDGGQTSADGDVTVEAHENATLDAGVGTGSFAGAAFGAVSAGASVTDSSSRSAIKAFIANSLVDAGGNINIEATAAGDVAAKAISTSVALALDGVAGAGARATSTLTTSVDAYTSESELKSLTAGNGISVRADVQPHVTAESGGFAGSTLATVGVSIASAINAPRAVASLGGDVTARQGDVSVAAAVDGLSNTAHARAVAVSLVASGSATRADAISGPVVRAEIAEGAAVESETGDVNVTAKSTGRSDGQSLGITVGGVVAVGDVLANASAGSGMLNQAMTREASTDALAGSRATVIAGGSILIDAYTSQAVRADTQGRQGGLIAVGTGSATAVRSTPTSASTDARELTADDDVSITAFNGYSDGGVFEQGNVVSRASNSNGGLVGAGVPKAVTTVDDSTSVTLGAGAKVGAKWGSVTFQATTSDLSVMSSAVASSGGLAAIPRAEATTTTNNPATATIGDRAVVNAGLNILVESRSAVIDSAQASADGKGLGINTRATARNLGTNNATTEIGQAELTAGLSVNVLAGKYGRAAGSSADALVSGGGAGIDTSAVSLVDKEFYSEVIITGATIHAPGTLRIAASSGTGQLDAVNSRAASDTGGLAGVNSANATTRVSKRASVTVQDANTDAGRTEMNTSDLQVAADNIVGLISTTASRYGTVAFEGGSEEAHASLPVNEGKVAFSADVTITGPVAYLSIDSAGQIVTAYGVGIFVEPHIPQYRVDPIVNSGLGRASITAGGGGFTDVTGTSTFKYGRAMGAVTLINDNAARELQVPHIITSASSSQPNLHISPNHLNYTAPTVTHEGGTPVNIIAAGDVGLGYIVNTQGSVNVKAEGDIRRLLNRPIAAQDISLAGRNIGTGPARTMRFPASCPVRRRTSSSPPSS